MKVLKVRENFYEGMFIYDEEGKVVHVEICTIREIRWFLSGFRTIG